jgi:hypothetical protein
MTLKNFLKENNINLSDADRSKLGHIINPEQRKFKKIKEDRCWVNDYNEEFLANEKTQIIMINFMTNR